MILVDGGLGTALQARGLPVGVAADTWVWDHPDEVAAVHRVFVDAGARIVLTATFRTLPDREPRWEEHVDRAVALAASAGAAVWGSLGPCTEPGRGPLPDDDASVAAIAERLWSHDAVTGLVIESIMNLDEGVAMVAAVARLERRNGPIVASVAPTRAGRTYDGTALLEAFRRLTSAGADVVGYNCGDGVRGALAAVTVARRWPRPVWAKPGALPGEDPMPALEAAVDGNSGWIGGCCGVSSDHLRALSLHVGG